MSFISKKWGGFPPHSVNSAPAVIDGGDTVLQPNAAFQLAAVDCDAAGSASRALQIGQAVIVGGAAGESPGTPADVYVCSSHWVAIRRVQNSYLYAHYVLLGL